MILKYNKIQYYLTIEASYNTLFKTNNLPPFYNHTMSNIVPKTRHGGRNKRFAAAIRKVDENKRKAVIEEKLRFLEDDFFEDPNKMAEIDDDDDGF